MSLLIDLPQEQRDTQVPKAIEEINQIVFKQFGYYFSLGNDYKVVFCDYGVREPSFSTKPYIKFTSSFAIKFEFTIPIIISTPIDDCTNGNTWKSIHCRYCEFMLRYFRIYSDKDPINIEYTRLASKINNLIECYNKDEFLNLLINRELFFKNSMLNIKLPDGNYVSPYLGNSKHIFEYTSKNDESIDSFIKELADNPGTFSIYTTLNTCI